MMIRPADRVEFLAACPCGRLAWWTATPTGAAQPPGSYRIGCPCADEPARSIAERVAERVAAAARGAA